MEVLVSDTLGFCQGVHRAVDIARHALRRAQREGRPLYFLGQIVHNKEVCAWFSDNGAKVLSSFSDAECGSIVVVRAHGIGDREREALISRGVEIVDATCPVVLKGQSLVRESDKNVLIFGYKGHSEVTTLIGSSVNPVRVISCVNDLEEIEKGEYNGVVQTTFSDVLLKLLLENAERKGIIINVLNHICKASINRREAVEKLLDKVDGFVVVGDKNSANTGELKAIAEKGGVKCYLVSDPSEIPEEIFSLSRVGLTAGASTPTTLYKKVIEALED